MPAWLAVMVQVPAAINVTVVSETEQREVVEEEKVTARPEEEVAESPTVPVPRVRGESGSKVMVWEALLKVKVAAVEVADS